MSDEYRRSRCSGGRAWRRMACTALVLAAWLVTPARTQAQEINGLGGEEIRLLQEASARESAGDLAGAERILRGVLGSRPTSLAALLSLERLLRVQARSEELIPFIERLLAADPRSAIGHQMMVRTYSSLDRLAAMERAAEAWVKATPRVETPYREVARVWQSRGEQAKAIQVLERGRSRLGRDNALALELGDLYAAQGDHTRAIREWDRAIGPNARGFMLVRRRLAALPDGGAHLIPGLIDALAQGSRRVHRLRAAADLAIDAGLAPRAEQMAKQVAALLKDPDRQIFLVEVGRRAEGARLTALAYWAYSELLTAGGPADQQLAVRARLADLALALGDTARARENYLALEQGFEAGSPERRHAAAFRIELTAREGNVSRAASEYEQFRKDFPDAPELDRLSAALADLLLGQGDDKGAERMLSGTSGSKSNLVRARLALRRGDVDAARAAYLAAAPQLRGSEATETILLATMLGKLSEAGGRLVGRAMSGLATGQAHEAVAILLGESVGLDRDERSVILDFAAAAADRAKLPEDAERIRRVLVEEYARAPEAPAALLGLARALIARGERLGEARELLERLILEHPRSALVPQARRELDRLQGRVPSS